MSKWFFAIVAALCLIGTAQVTDAHPYGYGYGHGIGGGCCGASWNGGNYDHLWAGYCGSRACGSQGWRANLWSGYCGQSACCDTGRRCRPRCSWLGGLRLRRACGLGYGSSCGQGCGCGAMDCGCGCGYGTASYGTASYGGCCGETSGETVIMHQESGEMAPVQESESADEAAPVDEAPAPPSDDASASLRQYNWSALAAVQLYR